MKHEVNPSKEDEITIFFIGDIMLGGDYAKFIKNNIINFDYAFRKIKNLFNEGDIVFCNLENPLFKTGRIRPNKGAILYAPPESINALKAINCKMVNLGNNHINDYGDESLIRTKQYLEDNGFITIGAGKNIAEALEPRIIDIKGVKIGFLSFTSSKENVTSVIATEDTAGCASFDDMSFVHRKIRELKKKVDYLFISLHWGYQHYYYPSPGQITMAHRMIDEGADVIIGHHPHVIQGVESYKNGIVFYSLGNFFFPDFKMRDGSMWRWNGDTRNSFVVELVLNTKGQMEYHLIPFTSDNFMVTPFSTEKRKEFLEIVFSLSKEIKNESYRQFWDLYCKKREKELERIRVYKATRILVESLSSYGMKNIIRKFSIKGLAYSSVLILKYSLFKIQECVQKILRWFKYEAR